MSIPKNASPISSFHDGGLLIVSKGPKIRPHNLKASSEKVDEIGAEIVEIFTEGPKEVCFCKSIFIVQVCTVYDTGLDPNVVQLQNKCSQNAVCGYLNFSAEKSLMELAAGLVSAVHYCTAGDQGVPHHTHMPVSRLFEELFKLREDGGRSVKNFLVLLNCFASNMVIFCQLDSSRKVTINSLCSL